MNNHLTENGKGSELTAYCNYYTPNSICAAGYYYMMPPNTGSIECLQCDSGMYTDVNGSYTCKACEAGKFNSLKGQSSCQNCNAVLVTLAQT